MRCFTVARINNNKSNFSADCEKSYVRCTFSVRTVFELLLLNCFRSLKDHSTLLLYYSHVISMYGDLCWNMICLFIEGLDTIDTSSKTGKRWNLFSSSQHRKRCVLAGTVYTKIWPIDQIDITNTFSTLYSRSYWHTLSHASLFGHLYLLLKHARSIWWSSIHSKDLKDCTTAPLYFFSDWPCGVCSLPTCKLWYYWCQGILLIILNKKLCMGSKYTLKEILLFKIDNYYASES